VKNARVSLPNLTDEKTLANGLFVFLTTKFDVAIRLPSSPF
jgi:hypothetical protein